MIFFLFCLKLFLHKINICERIAEICNLRYFLMY